MATETAPSGSTTSRRIRRSLSLKVLVSMAFALLLVGAAIFAPLVAGDPVRQNIRTRLVPPSWTSQEAQGHVLGSDHLGRDVFSRLVYGARISLTIAGLAVLIAGTLGTLLGLLAGHYGGWVDTIIMRLADIQLAFPLILLVMLLVAIVGPSVQNIVLTLGIAGWVEYARLVRAEVLRKREESFVEAASALGARPFYIMLRHLLPNVLAPIVVLATLAVPRMILIESALSWLGMSVPPPQPTWGAMVAEANDYLAIGWWLATTPGIAIVLTVLSITFIGDWLRELLDPRMHRSARA